MSTPFFLSLDGLDGTGKSTQCRLLVDWLRERGLAVTACVDPGGTELGARLREILLFGREQSMSLRTEAMLFMASRAELVDRVIRPALARGELVVSDRFTLANVVYQGHAGGLEPAELWTVGGIATGALEPDLTLIFDLPIETAQLRRGRSADRMEARGNDYQQRVRAGFLAESNGHLAGRCRVIDATPTFDVVQAEVRQVVTAFLRERGTPIREG